MKATAPSSSTFLADAIIYTDGACKGNPGAGGWGAWIAPSGMIGAHALPVALAAIALSDGSVELFGGDALTTNNRMELQAVIEALKAFDKPARLIIHLDSDYVRQGITTWIHGWKRKGWVTAKGEPVKNEDLWRVLDRLRGPHTIDWRWVKGHSGNPGNERADALANQGVAMLRLARR